MINWSIIVTVLLTVWADKLLSAGLRLTRWCNKLVDRYYQVQTDHVWAKKHEQQ